MIKTRTELFNGDLPAGLTAIPFSTQGYSGGLVLVRLQNKSADGTVTVTVGEIADDGVDDAFVWQPTQTASEASTYYEARFAGEFDAINYHVELYNNAKSAHAIISLFLHE